MRRWLINLGILTALIAPRATAGDAVVLKGGDRVVLIGGTLVEREAESGYLETRIARRLPGQAVVVRNLGWSGDTVEGISHGKINPTRDGFKELVDHVAALKPTVVVLGYGANESYNGAAGLPAFAAGLDRLWAELAKTGTRFVVLTPTPQENLGPPWPDPAAHNADLVRYGELLKAEAARRGATSVDLFAALPAPASGRPARPLTGNGLHFTAAGYWKVSAPIARALDAAPEAPWAVAIRGGRAEATGTMVSGLEVEPDRAKFRALDAFLPPPPEPGGGPPGPGSPRILRVEGLAPGRYRLAIDGRAAGSGDAREWRDGVAIGAGPGADQVEALRAKVVAKDLLYFHRWRPQNETYLFGMRKHEQGRNAAELAAFDPMIAAAEAEIARLSVPTAHTYELVRVPEGEVSR